MEKINIITISELRVRWFSRNIFTCYVRCAKPHKGSDNASHVSGSWLRAVGISDGISCECDTQNAHTRTCDSVVGLCTPRLGCIFGSWIPVTIRTILYLAGCKCSSPYRYFCVNCG